MQVTVLPAVAITLLSSRRGSIIGTSGSMITTRQGMRRQDNVLFISTAPTVLTVLQLIVRHPQSWSCPSKSCIIINCSQQLLCMLLSLAVPLLEINLDSDSEPDSDSPHPSSATSPSGILNPLR
ncbi:hypothetical protein CPB85DRAFT_369200 [Mucidula mucida]|nr:hypothetical protein CPB85DRAFT_369200 [Mucidula mucida]